MTKMHLSPDDPRLTAYALGELDGEERAAIEAALEANPELQRVVNSVQSLAGELTEAFSAEAKEPQLTVVPEPRDSRSQRVAQFPYYWIAGLAAAGFAVLVAVNGPTAKRPQTTIYELELKQRAPANSDGPATANGPEETTVTISSGLAEAPAPVFDERLDASKLSLAEIAAEAAASRSERSVPTAGHVPITPTMIDQAAAAAALASASPAERAAPAAVKPALLSGVSDQYTAVRSLAGVKREPREPATAPGQPTAFNTEQYASIDENPFQRVSDHPLSTFAVDVDTGSYANVRRMLNQAQRPPRDAVRIEELVNYFPYEYAPPRESESAPFAAHLEVASAPWASEHRLVRIGLKGREVSAAERGAANLVFLLDVSGSMGASNKLPLVKDALRQLVGQLRPDDRVAIVTYAGSSGLALPSTPARQSREILAALDALGSGGSTNGALGIHLAYDVAKANFVAGGVNRVILCTDGDFNVGVTNTGELTRLVAEKAGSGVYLTALGFGMGNYRDDMLERLADRGNGNYGYVDSLREARKLLVEQASGTLVTIAQDVKVQVEFNPAHVQAYRLIGYENRLLQKEDFNNDAIDAGEIGAGHTVTALYEVVPVGVPLDETPAVDGLKYQRVANAEDSRPASAGAAELLTVKLRYKTPGDGASQRLEFPLVDQGTSFAAASADFRFAAAVAGFGMVLRESPHRGETSLARVGEWGRDALGSDTGGHRREFLELVRQAMTVVGG